jgi:hypothetical protein
VRSKLHIFFYFGAIWCDSLRFGAIYPSWRGAGYQSLKASRDDRLDLLGEMRNRWLAGKKRRHFPMAAERLTARIPRAARMAFIPRRTVCSLIKMIILDHYT